MSPSCLLKLHTHPFLHCPKVKLCPGQPSLPCHTSLPDVPGGSSYLSPLYSHTPPWAFVPLEPFSERGEVVHMGLCGFLTANFKCQSWMDRGVTCPTFS